MAIEKLKSSDKLEVSKESIEQKIVYSLFNMNNYTVYLKLLNGETIILPSHGSVTNISEDQIDISNLPQNINPHITKN